MRIYDVKWKSHSAGPSPKNNERIEVFLAGCKIASNGHPCKNCFNPGLWNPEHVMVEDTAKNIAENIYTHAYHKYITFVGGEPLDQIDELAEVCKLLKEYGFHILVFTHYEMEEVVLMKHGMSLLNNIDILIDGKYDESERIFDDVNFRDGFRNSVGSGNQVIWDLNNHVGDTIGYGMPARDLVGLYLTKNDELKFITKDSNSSEKFVRIEVA